VGSEDGIDNSIFVRMEAKFAEVADAGSREDCYYCYTKTC